MSKCYDQYPNPKDPKLNRCSDAKGDVLTGEETRICLSKSYGEIGINFCKSIGSGEEWIRAAVQNRSQCCSNKAFPGVMTNNNDLDTCGSWCGGDYNSSASTYTGECQRIKFAADPVVCCFLDNDCVFEDPTIQNRCWETDLRDKTCDPKNRDLSSSSCLEKILPYCTGEQLFLGQENWWDLWVEDTQVDINSNEIVKFYPGGSSRFIPAGYADHPPPKSQTERKMKQPCLRALARAISRDQQFCTWEKIKDTEFRRGNYDPEGLAWAQKVVNAIFDKYNTEFGSFVGGINTDGKQIDSMINVFSEICTRFPVLCQAPLKNICQGITVDDIVGGNVPNAEKWCGCYMQENQYQKYTDLYQVNRECTPFCNADGVIPLVDADGYELYCLTDVCIIDDLKLNFVRDKIKGNKPINFSLLCGGCGGSNVKTVINSDRDFNTQRNTIVGIYSGDIFDTQVCTQPPSNGRPTVFTSIFGKTGSSQATVVAVGQNNNRINVTLKLSSITSGNNLFIYSISFVSASVINANTIFKNGEKLTLEDHPLNCNIYALTVDTNAVNNARSTTNMFRRHEVIENQCTCILDGTTINIIDSEFKNFNLSQNCGKGNCNDSKGNPIPCGSSNTDQNNDYYSQTDAIRWAKNNAKKKKYNGIGIILFAILILFIVISIGIGLGKSFLISKKK
jgi:hypothetical protein